MTSRNKLLLVDPESNCRLVDPNDGVCSWLIEFNKPLVYEYHEPGAKDYLTMVGTIHGKLDLFRHIEHTKSEISSQIVCYGKEENLEVFLNTCYGGAKCVRSSETIYVNGDTGAIIPEEKEEVRRDGFLIIRNSYEMKLYATRHFETRISWQLNYSSFKAFYPLVNQEVRDPLRVFHTINQADFDEFCKDFNVNPFHIRLFQNLKWKHPKK